jgi:hypothetical protein
MPLERSKKWSRLSIEWNSRLLICANNVNFLDENINIIKKNMKVLLDMNKLVYK